MSALPNRLEWLVAWRHLRMGDQVPAWVRAVMLLSLVGLPVSLVLAVYPGLAPPASGVQFSARGMFALSTTGLTVAMLAAGSAIPSWARWLTLLSLYLLVIGILLAGYAVFLGYSGATSETVVATPLSQHYGLFGGLAIVLGIMGITLGLLGAHLNLLPTIITMSVLLGCMALVVVLSLMSGLEGDLRDKILNQKAHVRISRSDGRPFSDYDALSDALARGEGIAGASPYLEGEIMVRSGLNRQGAILSGIKTDRQTTVSNLRELVKEGDYRYLDDPQDIPEPDPFAFADEQTPYRLRHLEEERKKNLGLRKKQPVDEDAADEGEVERPAGTKSPPNEAKDSVNLGPAAKLPSLAPKPLEPDGESDEGDDEDAEGWEDPTDALGVLPSKPEPIEPDESLGVPGLDIKRGVLSDLPKPPAIPTPVEEGWEDPSKEIARLREEGVLPEREESPETEEAPETEGFDESDEGAGGDPVLIGRELALELSVRVGSNVQLITPVGRITPAGQLPGFLKARVAGVFFSGMYEYDRKNVYAPLPVVQRFLLTGDRVSGIEVKLIDVEAIDEGKAEVERIVAQQGRDDLMVEDWRDLNRNLFSAMFLEKVAMFIALLFVVLVASFGILASNLMSVMEKSKEIAILKAMGTTDAGVMRVFVAEGLCVGLLGSFGGIAMGLAVCWALDRFGLPLNENVYYIEKLPVVVNPVEVALVGGAALVIVCFSSLYPALVASRLRPIDALRPGDG